MTQSNWKYRVLSFAVLFVALGATPALAYQFGPPPITELAEAGGTQNRVSLYQQTTAYDSPASSLTPTLQGISLATSSGDNSGATTGMFRLARYTDNRTVAP